MQVLSAHPLDLKFLGEGGGRKHAATILVSVADGAWTYMGSTVATSHKLLNY